MKHQDEYLYDTNEVPQIPTDIVNARLDLLKANLEKLLYHSYYTRDNVRVNAVLKAIHFWENINES